MTWELLEPESARPELRKAISTPPQDIQGAPRAPYLTPRNLAEGAKQAAHLPLFALEAALSGVGGIPGAAIEAPSQLTQLLYESAGRAPPAWTQGPSTLRLGSSGRPFIKTPEELLESGGISGAGAPQNDLENALAPYLQVGGGLAGTGAGSLIPSVLGAMGLFREGSKALGLHGPLPALAEVLATTGVGAASSAKGRAQEFASQGGKELSEVARAEGVTTAPAAIQAQGRRGASALLRSVGKAGEKVQERAKKFADQIEESYHNVLGEVFQPYKSERNMQVLRDQTSALFNPVEEIASQSKVRIPTQDLIADIDEQLGSLKQSKAPSSAETDAIRYLDDARNRLKASPTVSLGEGVRTFRSLNKAVQWDSPTRGDIHVIKAKEALRRDLKRYGGSEPGFVDNFDLSNTAWTELNRLGEATSIMKNAVNSDGTFNLQGLYRSIKNKENTTVLKKSLGESLYNRLEKIAELGEEGRKNFARVGALLPEDLQALNNAIGIGAGLMQGQEAAGLAARILGRDFAAQILTSPNLQTNYIGYLGALRRDSPKLAAYYLRKLGEQVAQPEQPEWELIEASH